MVQPAFEEVFDKDHQMKGRWHEFFGNNNLIVLELGCGRGEYTVALAERNSDKNFIGVDIKGARMWRGAKTATEQKMGNVGFLRTRIEFINSFFAAGEVAEIWITFPDPQLKTRRAKKRLTSPVFLNYYAQILEDNGWINLKTDSQHLFNYTAEVVRRFELPCEVANNDIYGSGYADEVLSVKTAYEQVYLRRGLPITYTRFSLGARSDFEMFDWEGDDVLEKDAEESRL
jgi:tRNA (guanine-N7-)-methyltransferase